MSPEATGPINENLARRRSGRGRVLKSRAVETALGACLVATVAAGAAVAAYASSQQVTSTASVPQVASAADELRLGYFGNLTHAPALVGLETGMFEDELGDTSLTAQAFNAGPAAVEALNAGALDAAFIGPNPAINSYIQSEGESLRVVAGATSGGAQLVVRPGIGTADDLRGATLATPQLGNTQDVALRTWLADNGLSTGTGATGDVLITPTENALSLQLFANGDLDGAWVPEPWASRLVLQAGGTVLVDEKDLWPGGRFPTTLLVVSSTYLADHPEQVEALLRGELRALQWLEANTGGTGAAGTAGNAADVLNRGLEAAQSKALPDAVLNRALGSLEFTQDPLGGSLEQLLADAIAAGTAQEYDIGGILDLTLLNDVRAESALDPVSATGSGEG
ncbi:ABC transporter substrate-binding protein [Arthrobacter sp. NamB2]|uniref:ABC transporter substrate-binding protein n=1 Tax=Arthrobacter sp. NamB2 TaxID=2576035 RepID=UPI0010C942C0|nr:ABC transporter substrate-binding protein [Arthrobacter sp. NamB2]TKV29979.1 ABC transporter substrate-binding protein [Arthrobacter sp. NamB2]